MDRSTDSSQTTSRRSRPIDKLDGHFKTRNENRDKKNNHTYKTENENSFGVRLGNDGDEVVLWDFRELNSRD